MTALLETRGVWQRFGALSPTATSQFSVGRGEIVGLIVQRCRQIHAVQP